MTDNVMVLKGQYVPFPPQTFREKMGVISLARNEYAEKRLTMKEYFDSLLSFYTYFTDEVPDKQLILRTPQVKYCYLAVLVSSRAHSFVLCFGCSLLKNKKFRTFVCAV